MVNQAGSHEDVDVFIGGFAGGAGNGTQFLNGMIDEVRISNVARSNDWLDLSFQNQRPNQVLVNIGATASARRGAGSPGAAWNCFKKAGRRCWVWKRWGLSPHLRVMPLAPEATGARL
jgi:hypothetical protein